MIPNPATDAITGPLIARIADKVTDWPAILEGVATFSASTELGDILPPPNSPAFICAVRRALDLEQTTVILADHGGLCVGGIGLFISPYVWNLGELSAVELFWFCDPGAPPRAGLMLLREAIRFARQAGATILTFSALTTSPAGVTAAYRRAGMRPAQVNYVGRIAP